MAGGAGGAPGEANFYVGLAYFIKAFVGPGCLSLPLAFQNCGLGLGLFLLACMGFIVTYNLRTMVLCKQHVEHKGIRTYADLTQEALGDTARRVVETLVNGVQLGICAVYFDFFAENAMAMLSKRHQTDSNFYICMVLIFPVYCALATLKSIDAIAPYAALANALVYGAIGVVLFAAVENIHAVYFLERDHNDLEWFKPAKAPLFYSTAVYSFEGVCSLLPVENALARPKEDMLPVTYAGMAVVTFTYAAVGAIAYAAWPDVESGSITAEVNNNATNGYWYALALTANVATVIAVVLTFPVQLFPSIELLERTFGVVQSSSAQRSNDDRVKQAHTTTHRLQQPSSGKKKKKTKTKTRRKVRSTTFWSWLGPAFFRKRDPYYEAVTDEDEESVEDSEYLDPSENDDDDDFDDDDPAAGGTRDIPPELDHDDHDVATSGHVELLPVTAKKLSIIKEESEDPESCPEKEEALVTKSLLGGDEPVRRRALATTAGASDNDARVCAAAVDDSEWPLKRVAFRVAVVFAVGLVAALVPDLGDLIALIGALTGSALSLVVPSLIDLYCPRPNRKKWEVPCDVIIISLGVLGGLLGTIQAVLNVVGNDDDVVDDRHPEDSLDIAALAGVSLVNDDVVTLGGGAEGLAP